MMPTKSCSTGKLKVKSSQLTRMAEYSAQSKILLDNMNKKDYERPQPVKIAQLLKEFEGTKSAHKDSARKRPMQPERLGKSTSKKMEATKENETRQFIKPGKSVRRILNFNEPSGNAVKKKYDSKDRTNRFKTEKCTSENIARQLRRQSSIPLPNAIKKKQLQECMNKVNQCSKIAEVSKETDNTYDEPSNKKGTNSINESSNVNINCTELRCSRKTCNEPVISNNMNDIQRHKIANIHPEMSIFQDEDFPQIIITNSEDELITGTSERSELCMKPKENPNSVQNLCKDLQSTNIVDDENNTRTEDGLSNVLRVERDKLISVQHHLEDCLRRTEEDAIRLRASLTCIASLISTLDNKANGLSDTKLQKRHNIMVDKEVQVEICPEERLDTSNKNIPMPESERLIEDDEGNKENEDLSIIKLSGVTTNSSFLELENELNIIHTEPTQCSFSSHPRTPLINKYKQKSFREYMALKSSVSFLETPDGQRFKSLCHIDNTDESDLNKTSLSKKLLKTILSLNSESPDSDL